MYYIVETKKSFSHVSTDLIKPLQMVSALSQHATLVQFAKEVEENTI